jgi:hypothetical protein
MSDRIPKEPFMPEVPSLPQDVEEIRSKIAEDRVKLKTAEAVRKQHQHQIQKAGVTLKKVRRSLRQAAAS